MKMKFNFKFTMLLSVFLTLSSFLVAQRTVTGTITDGTSGLPGASVLIPGTTKGTVTDLDGKFSLQVPADATQLKVTFVGMKDEMVSIPATNVINLAMSEASALETIVVTGYGGTLKAKQVTSSIATIKAEDFNTGAINDPTSLIAGKVAGLVVAQPGGDPNAAPVIRLRGITTISANQAPLYIVDGIPLDQGLLSTLNVNDIEEVNVLKDGSAAALYGARASSGVIIYTTKKGKPGQSYINYDPDVRVTTVANRVKNMDAATYVANGGNNLGGSTNWFDQITNTGVSTSQRISAGGGIGKGTTYRASINFNDINGVALNDGYKLLNGRLNLTQYALNDKLKLGLTIVSTNQDATPGAVDAFRYAVIYNPTATPLGGQNASKYGGYTQLEGFDNFNPVAIINQSHYNTVRNALQTSLNASYELIDGLKIGGIYSRILYNSAEKDYYDKLAYFRGKNADGLAQLYNDNRVEDYYQGTLTYEKTIDKLNINLLGGYDLRDITYSGTGISAGGFPSDALGADNLSASADVIKGSANIYSYKGTDRDIAFFGRAYFGWDDTYNLAVSVRREGYSAFSEGNKWGIFPGVSASVNLNKFLNISNLDALKLRVGYGITGALPINDYLTQNTFAINRSANNSYGPVRNASTNLKWEQKAETNVGFDFAFKNTVLNGLSGSLEYYSRDISDILFNYTVLPAGAFEQSSIWANGGGLKSSGFEALINYDVFKTANTKWKTSLNFATYSSTLKSIKTDVLQVSPDGTLKDGNVGAPGLNGIPYTIVGPNQPLGQIYSFKYSGPNPTTGAPQAYDYKGVARDITTLNDSSKVVVGNGLPTFTFGWTNTFTFGHLDIGLGIRGAFGHSLVNEFRIFYENANKGTIQSYNRIYTKYYDPKLTDIAFTSLQVEKGDYVKVDNLTIGYNIPVGAGKLLSKLRVYASVNNLLTITGYTGVDPEIRFNDLGSVDNGNNNTRNTPDGLVTGIDRRNTYFTTRTFSFGLNVGF